MSLSRKAFQGFVSILWGGNISRVLIFYLLFWKRNTERQRGALASTGSFPKGWEQQGLGQVKARSQGPSTLVAGSTHLSWYCCLWGYAGAGSWNQKQSWDRTQASQRDAQYLNGSCKPPVQSAYHLKILRRHSSNS